MRDRHVTLELREKSAWLTLSRPESLNALSRELIEQLDAAVDEISAQADIRVTFVTGRGRAFCAGADLKEVNGTGSPTPFLDIVATAFGKLRSLPMPVIGGLNGITVAGGLELALCCDLLIAAESAKIGDAHINYGLLPGGGGAAILPGRMGLHNAKYMLFMGHSLPASEWRRMGVVQEVVPDDRLQTRLEELSEQFQAKSPLALTRMKQIANAVVDLPLQEALDLEMNYLRKHVVSRDFAEGLAAFSEKRRPQFTGE